MSTNTNNEKAFYINPSEKKLTFQVSARLIHAFFYKQHFTTNAKLKFAKNQAYAKQHPEDELLQF